MKTTPKKLSRVEMLPAEFTAIRVRANGKKQLIPNFKKTLPEFAELFKTMPVEYFQDIELLTYSGHKIEVSNKTMEGKYKSAVVYLLQGDLSGYEICAFRTESCSNGCLGTHSGQAAIIKGNGTKNSDVTNTIQVARLAKTIMFFKHRELFLTKLFGELVELKKKADKEGVKLGFRFNGTSDLPFHNFKIPALGVTFLEYFNDVAFYDYTKSELKAKQFAEGKLPSNYSVVYSYTPENHNVALEMLNRGVNVATAFKTRSQSDLDNKTFLNAKLVTGDMHDLRFVEYMEGNKGVIISLTAKGFKYKKDTSGFFVDVNKLENFMV